MSQVLSGKYNKLLAKLFSASVLSELSKEGSSPFLNEIINLPGICDFINADMTVGDIYKKIYQNISKTYRNEYIYKNAIANKILLGTHSLNTSFMLMEFRVRNTKADVVVLNGTSNVYEVKSELDSFKRLGRQIAAYRRVFDKINVIVSPSQVPQALKKVNPTIGILALGNRGNIQTVRQACSSVNHLCQADIFEALRRCEQEAILKKHLGHIPKVPNAMAFQAYKKLFLQLPPKVAHDEMVVELKKRGKCSSLRKFINSVPFEFKALALSPQFDKRSYDKLNAILETPYRKLQDHAYKVLN